MKQGVATVAQLAEFDEIIDARSPAEYAEDRIPGAVSCPALDDAERARVGTLYKQSSPFEAKRIGAALLARHVADYLETRFADRPRSWRPLVYCWRGGKRSGAFVTIFRQIGWDAAQLEGGYKAYRRQVVGALTELPATLRYRVVCGATGSGKSRLLQALARRGAQVLDLEALAAHKGSVLGDLPDEPQPGQKQFETQLLAALRALDPAREVYVEAESRRIGTLSIPGSLITTMRGSPCVVVDAPPAARVAFLLRDYEHFLAAPQRLEAKLACLRSVQGGERVERWLDLVRAGEWPELVMQLLVSHYDPLYHRSQGRNYSRYAEGRRYASAGLGAADIDDLATRILADAEAPTIGRRSTPNACPQGRD